MLDRKKENNTVCSSINSPSNLVNNVFASVHYLGLNIKFIRLNCLSVGGNNNTVGRE